ncbi:hypothetical protein AGRO_5201 [Agrobacterium sp. ATCC 31749]|nr:hypothetical protein AGRO_5201 [Agrobacterium sp. ATCC 31749]
MFHQRTKHLEASGLGQGGESRNGVFVFDISRLADIILSSAR